MSFPVTRTVGRSKVDSEFYDDSVVVVADQLAESLEGGPYALFFSPDEKTGIALEDNGEYLLLYLFVNYIDEGVWVRNSPGLVEVRIPGDWDDAWEALADELLNVMPSFQIDEAEEIPVECVGGEDMGECWPE